MKATDKIQLLERVRTLEGLTDSERDALLALINENKTYGLVWEDKPEAVEKRLALEYPVLTEVKDRAIISDKSDVPNHILIEGDNLEALTTLSYTHEGKIDVIYIDPPYNTGNKDFIYNDSFVDTEDTYRHSKWLSFMSRRLRIAKKLLSERGIIYISIGDDEDAQLKLLCNDIFGEKNKISDVIWQSRKSVSNDAMISLNHNYTLIYCKNINALTKYDFRLFGDTSKFSNPDNDPNGAWVADPFDAPEIRDNLCYPIINPNTGETILPARGRHWRTTEKAYLDYLSKGMIVFGKKGTSKPQLKRYLKDCLAKTQTPISIWNDIETTTNGTQLLDQILGERRFNNPKPIELILRILVLSSLNNSTVLDFFAGSGTTLHAVMQLNAKDGGNRQCILCTNNENCICENVTYERNKRVIQGYTKPNGEKVEGMHDNNLRYYRTDFVSRERTQKNRRELMEKSTDLLCIKENLYTELPKFGHIGLNPNGARFFTDGKKQMLIIYRPEFIPYFVEEIDKMEVPEPIKIYIYAPDRYAYDDEFTIVAEKVSLCASPQNIIDAMARVMPEKVSEKTMEEIAPTIESKTAEQNSLFGNLEN